MVYLSTQPFKTSSDILVMKVRILTHWRIRTASLLALHLFLGSRPGLAETFPLSSSPYQDTVGVVQETRAEHEDTLIDIGRRFGLGYDEIVKANSRVNRWVPGKGQRIILPRKHVLPDAPRKGIVLNIAELRLYYYPVVGKGRPSEVVTFPISIGRMDWKTPLGTTRVVKKEKDPPWRPTESIKREHAAEGDPLPDVIRGGDPENPLGHYALRLAIPNYLIHGVDDRKANGIGMRVTHGCVRMYPEDIEELYNLVPVKTPVTIVDQPIKLGWDQDQLVLQVISPLDEDEEDYPFQISTEETLRLVREKAGPSMSVDEDAVARAVERSNGIPVVVARRGAEFDQERVSQERPASRVHRYEETGDSRDAEYEPPAKHYPSGAGSYKDDRGYSARRSEDRPRSESYDYERHPNRNRRDEEFQQDRDRGYYRGEDAPQALYRRRPANTGRRRQDYDEEGDSEEYEDTSTDRPRRRSSSWWDRLWQ
jgi:L,D-transpeptidase ErfK/SrfK